MALTRTLRNISWKTSRDMPLLNFEHSPLPTIFPDETIYSLVSRLHANWGYPLASRTSSILFGKARGGYHHDLPSCLSEFCSRTENAYGDVAEICLNRTLLKSDICKTK